MLEDGDGREREGSLASTWKSCNVLGTVVARLDRRECVAGADMVCGGVGRFVKISGGDVSVRVGESGVGDDGESACMSAEVVVVICGWVNTESVGKGSFS